MQHNIPITPIQLDSSSAIKITMGGSMFQERSLMGRPDVWHKIQILRGAKYDKEYILKLILNTVEPADLIPVAYQVSGEDTYFIARNCGPALDKLCRCNLIINDPYGDPLVLTIVLAFASIHDVKVNMQSLVLAALNKRYDSKKKRLHLDRFHNDKNLSKTVYCPLSQLRTFCYVLKVAKNALSTFEHLNLQQNELFSLTAIESSNLTFLKSLDLRYNNLLEMDALTPLRSLTITELWLDGNPLCENYSSPIQYIESARKYCPQMSKLDGVSTGAPGMPLTYNSYFINWKMRNLVNQFIKHFFKLYDQEDRAVLQGLYHKDALYSMTLGVASTVASKSNMSQFISHNRNLLKLTDFAKSNQLLFRGPDKILEALRKLPRSQHDKASFRYDLIYDNELYLVVIVEGVFKEDNVNSRVFSFNRTFVLMEGGDYEYNIVNDQYHVDQTLTQEFSEISEQNSDNEYEVTCFSPKERDKMIETLHSVTTMNKDWCRKFLEETSWDIKKSITDFMDRYRLSAIPVEAFWK
ncbi:nuclear RNA export factor 1 [Cephus cinctus]|uniref:Nuclear RNA export factor 1 n=1 Tax=Cephus cinctus TaxID=211228 RepID=A0AAJ7C467_CEPCN|nr:nuclear RNA export factor 1 [Cephus cinctus]